MLVLTLLETGVETINGGRARFEVLKVVSMVRPLLICEMDTFEIQLIPTFRDPR